MTEEKQNLPTLSVDNYAAKTREPKQKLGNPSAQKDGNPWEEDGSVETLPVYENIAYAGEADQKAVPAEDGMLDQKLRAAANVLDLTIHEIRYDREIAPKADQQEDETDVVAEDTEDKESGAMQHAYKATAYTQDGTITVTYNNFTKITFDTPKVLPETYCTAASEMDSETAEQLTGYLLEQYGVLMGFSNPKTSIRMFYDKNGETRWILAGYDAGENLQEQIVSYNLKRMRFTVNEMGQLTGIMMMDNLASGRKIEEYPIITASEAKGLLEKGEYIAGSSKLPSLDQVERCTLVYLTGPQCNIFMPYYAFDVRTDEADGALMHYSTYYVPAVQEAYLSKMPASSREIAE